MPKTAEVVMTKAVVFIKKGSAKRMSPVVITKISVKTTYLTF